MRVVFIIALFSLVAACSQNQQVSIAADHPHFDAPTDCNNPAKRWHPDYQNACDREP